MTGTPVDRDCCTRPSMGGEARLEFGDLVVNIYVQRSSTTLRVGAPRRSTLPSARQHRLMLVLVSMSVKLEPFKWRPSASPAPAQFAAAPAMPTPPKPLAPGSIVRDGAEASTSYAATALQYRFPRGRNLFLILAQGIRPQRFGDIGRACEARLWVIRANSEEVESALPLSDVIGEPLIA